MRNFERITQWILLLVLGLAILSLAACNPAPEVEVKSPPPPTAVITLPPDPTSTATSTATETPLPSKTPTPAIKLPVLVGTPLPKTLQKISASNAVLVREIAHWGKGSFEEFQWAPDGSSLAFLTMTKLFLYDIPTFQEKQIDVGGSHLSYSPDGKKLVVLTDSGKTSFVDISSGKVINSYWPGDRHSVSAVNGIAFSPDGKWVAVVYTPVGFTVQDFIQLFDSVNFQPIRKIAGAKVNYQSPEGISFSPDGRWIAGSSGTLWDPASGKTMCSVDPGTITFLPDRNEMVSLSNNNAAVKVYDERCNQIRSVGYETSNQRSWTLSPDQKILASFRTNTIVLWKMSDGSQLPTLRDVSFWTFSRDGTAIITANKANTIQIWNAASGALTNTLTGDPKDNILSLDLLPRSDLLAVRSKDKLTLWDTATAKVSKTLSGFDLHSPRFRFSPDGHFLLGNPHWSGAIKRWDLVAGKELPALEFSFSGGDVAFSPDGNTLAVGNDNGEVQLFNAFTGELKNRLLGCCESASISFSPDGSKIVSAALLGRRVTVWDTAQAKLDFSFENKSLSFYTRNVLYSPDGKTIAVSSDDREITLWEAGTGKMLRTLAGHTKQVRTIAFSPDGRSLASSAGDDVVILWDISTGQQLKQFASDPQYHSPVYEVAFSPDGTKLAIAGRAITLWDFKNNTQLFQKDSHALAIAFSPDGDLLLLIDSDTVQIMDTKTGNTIGKIDIFKQFDGDFVYKAVFSPNGTSIASISRDGIVRLWGIVP